jgi:hypothetical protein
MFRVASSRIGQLIERCIEAADKGVFNFRRSYRGKQNKSLESRNISPPADRLTPQKHPRLFFKKFSAVSVNMELFTTM